jgi:Secretion system C-terminal sorting domain
VSGKNLQSFFQKWVYKEGYPNYNATWTTNKNNWVKVELNQTTSHISVGFYDMPIDLQFKNGTKDTIFRVQHTYNGQTFWVNPGFVPDTLVIDPNYWVLSGIKTSVKIMSPNLKADEVKIFPNPAPDYIGIYVFNPTASSISLKLYNEIGQLVYHTDQKLTGRDEQLFIKYPQLPKGVYYLNINDAKRIKRTFKILK